MASENRCPKCPLTDDQIKHMVNRFLAWKSPEDFAPYVGISFKPILRDGEPWPEVWPVGMATQAEAMIRYLVDGIQHGGVCLWCGFSTTRGSLDELADAIYAHLGECHASPVPALIAERDAALDQVVALRCLIDDFFNYAGGADDPRQDDHLMDRAVDALTDTQALANQRVEAIRREAASELMQALRDYGQHQRAIPELGVQGCDYDPEEGIPCTCGLAAILDKKES